MRGGGIPYCKKCGKELEASAKFCPNCGTPVSVKAVRVAVRAPKKSTSELLLKGRWGVPIGVQLTIAGVLVIIFGVWLMGQSYVGYSTYYSQYLGNYTVPTSVTSLEPYGLLVVMIGVTITILGVWKWSLNMHR
jgi:uncharacterized membrane protein